MQMQTRLLQAWLFLRLILLLQMQANRVLKWNLELQHVPLLMIDHPNIIPLLIFYEEPSLILQYIRKRSITIRKDITVNMLFVLLLRTRMKMFVLLKKAIKTSKEKGLIGWLQTQKSIKGKSFSVIQYDLLIQTQMRVYRMKSNLIIQIQILMLLILILLSVTANSYNIYCDISTVTVQHPLYSQPILQKNYTMAEPNPMENSNWIWTNGTTRSATFESIFHARFSSSANLYIKANNTFYAYVNGVSVKAGIKYESTYTSIRLACGLNNLTIQVENKDPLATSSGLVFLISQAQNYNCGNSGFYNMETCACDCLGDFQCMSNQQMIGYPTCACACTNQGITRCNGYNQYFDTKTCACQCFPTYCQPNFGFDQTTCTCRCKPATCSNGAVWNYNQCRCL